VSASYAAVQWSPHKRTYDACVAGAVIAYIVVFVVISKIARRDPHQTSDEILVISALGSCAIVLLNVILCIGPLARLDRRFLPLLFNRRHLGVITFLVALAHAIVAIGYYHGFGVVNPLVSLLTSNQDFASFRGFPFELLGLLALAILFLMAATSHDFWLKNLSQRAWKLLHMLVYVAYGLLVGHVALGALQTDRGWLGPALVCAGAFTVAALHLVAGSREVRRDSSAVSAEEVWIDAGEASSFPQDRARTICVSGGERIAIFNHAGGISAVTNLCAHQGGPLGEGKVIDGCITCPWHGWQYRPQDGRSPPPFQEKIATYQVRVVGGRVQVNATPLPAGTPTEPAQTPANQTAATHA